MLLLADRFLLPLHLLLMLLNSLIMLLLQLLPVPFNLQSMLVNQLLMLTQLPLVLQCLLRYFGIVALP